jgi:hypothetical protein
MELDRKYLKVLENEMNLLGEKILEKDETTGNRRGDLHTALWVLKDRVDEIHRIRKDTKVSRESRRS